MHGYRRDEYENWDEYENDGSEQEEEENDEGGYDEEETHQPTKDELEYLELRQRLKESIRKQRKKELGTASAGSREKVNTHRKDNYGSFFGRSQPVIAQRVIQESKSLLENPNLAARITKSTYDNNKSSVAATARSKPQASLQPKVTSGLKKKVEMLKNTRDYSFLLSEDAEVPGTTKTPPSRNVPVPKSEAQSSQLPSKSRQVVDDRGREVSNGVEHRKQVIAGSQNKVWPKKIDHANSSSVGSRKQLGSNNGSGPGRPLEAKSVHSKSVAPSLGTKVSQSMAKSSMVGRDKSNPSSVQSVVRKPTTSLSQSGVRKPTPSSSQPSLSKNHLVQRKAYQETSKAKVIPKQALPTSRSNVKQQSTKVSARSTLTDVRPKKQIGRQLYDEDSDGDKAISMIRQMFRYNPNKYRDVDDDSDMEANFDDIMAEEDYSAKIARQEDEEELRLLEEEERRKQLKRRKLSHE